MTDAIGRLTNALSDRYRIDRELGQGGMATVYLALNLKHGRKVAFKVLRPELSAVIGGDRFLAKIKVTAIIASIQQDVSAMHAHAASAHPELFSPTASAH